MGSGRWVGTIRTLEDGSGNARQVRTPQNMHYLGAGVQSRKSFHSERLCYEDVTISPCFAGPRSLLSYLLIEDVFEGRLVHFIAPGILRVLYQSPTFDDRDDNRPMTMSSTTMMRIGGENKQPLRYCLSSTDILSSSSARKWFMEKRRLHGPIET